MKLDEAIIIWGPGLLLNYSLCGHLNLQDEKLWSRGACVKGEPYLGEDPAPGNGWPPEVGLLMLLVTLNGTNDIEGLYIIAVVSNMWLRNCCKTPTQSLPFTSILLQSVTHHPQFPCHAPVSGPGPC